MRKPLKPGRGWAYATDFAVDNWAIALRGCLGIPVGDTVQGRKVIAVAIVPLAEYRRLLRLAGPVEGLQRLAKKEVRDG